MSAIIEPGDCLETLRQYAEMGMEFDSIVTDPPYHLTSIVKRFGKAGAAPAQHGSDGAFARASAGFMGKAWDGGDIAFRPETWELALRVLKPGGHIVAFGSSRGYHRMACAIEDAGFEVRDSLMWAYGTGFPKSHDVSKGIDKMLGAEREVVAPPPYTRGRASHSYSATRKVSYDYDPLPVTAPGSPEAAQWQGWGTALKPAFEPIVLARKPLAGTVADNVLAHGTGALNIDGCRVGLNLAVDASQLRTMNRSKREEGAGWGMSRAGGDVPQVVRPDGRWPANILHDGSPEVLEAFAFYGETGARAPVKGTEPSAASVGRVTGERARVPGAFHADGGTAARFFAACGYGDEDRLAQEEALRFFYSGKAPSSERVGNHPTQKPVSLMRWLARLVTPPGGMLLDPFAGTGTTGEAAILEGFSAVLCEREAEYLPLIEQRLARARAKMAAEAEPIEWGF